jgi:hypothetical protein
MITVIDKTIQEGLKFEDLVHKRAYKIISGKNKLDQIHIGSVGIFLEHKLHTFGHIVFLSWTQSDGSEFDMRFVEVDIDIIVKNK